MLEPVQYQKKLEGKSNAHLITFNDGRDYVVKYFQPGFEKTLPNEWVGYGLARFMGLPVPFAKIIEMPDEFTTRVPEIDHPNISKHQFASLYVPACFDGHQVGNVPAITNNETLAGIILLDYWLCNRDRTRKNILLCQDTTESYRLWMIDQAEIFNSYSWGIEDVKVLPDGLMKSATHQLMARFIKDENDFYHYLELVQTTPILLIEELFNLIPDDWMISPDEKKAAIGALLKRRKEMLPRLMRRIIKRVYNPLKESEL